MSEGIARGAARGTAPGMKPGMKPGLHRKQMGAAPPSRDLQAVIFDLDGTLLDTAPEFVVAVNRLRAEHRLAPLPAAEIAPMVSNGARAMVALALGIVEGGIAEDGEGFEAKRQRFLDIYAADLGGGTQPYPGIRELLAQLAQLGIPWGISTNKPSWLTEPLVAAMGFEPPPCSIVCPDHVSRPKPDPEPLLLNCAQLGCEPGSAIYIGDHRRDIEAGRAAGIYTIAAAYGYIAPGERVSDWGADAVAASSEELMKRISGVMRPTASADASE